MRRSRLGFLSVTGVVVGAITLVGLLSWTLVMGPALFSPGQLNSVAKARTRGGISSHAQLPSDCGACHTAPWSSQTMAERCLACHQEVNAQIQNHSGLHAGLVGALSSPTCRGCHTEHHGPGGALTVLDAATFPHNLTGYSLRGHKRTTSGAKFTCGDCHPKDLSHFDEATCADCHTAIDANFMRQHEASFGKRCLLCHNGSSFDAANFDHSKLPFKLTGKHVGLACERCHSKVGSLQAFQNTPQECGGCHAKKDEHKGKFGMQCGQCHSTNGWDNAQFDHTIFPVNHGSENQVATCKTCHPTDVASYSCYGCHEHTLATVRADHEGKNVATLSDCIRCHPGGREAGD